MFVLLWILVSLFRFGDSVECLSCLSSCRIGNDGKLDMNECDCVGNSTCVAENCFAKVELFGAESIAIIQKGCADNQPSGPSGCHFAGQPESIHCYCDTEKCNNRHELNDYIPKTLPLVECCECSVPNGEKCDEEKCTRSCRGNYCLIDFDGVEQGCGVGLPRLKNFLRIQNYTDLQNGATCARYSATQSTIVHGCVCTTPNGHCNEVQKSRDFQQKNVIFRRTDDSNYCYSLHQKSHSAFGSDVFKNSETCEGHFCFVSMTTSELAVENGTDGEFVGVGRSRFELLAGCVKVDDDSKVSIGCTTEFTDDPKNPISRHCICDSHLCNSFLMLSDRTEDLALEDHSDRSNAQRVLFSAFILILSVLSSL